MTDGRPPRAGAHRARTGPRLPRAALAALAVAVVGLGAGGAVWLASRSPTPPAAAPATTSGERSPGPAAGSDAGTGGERTPPDGAAAAAAADLARWTESELPPDVAVAVPEALRTALTEAGADVRAIVAEDAAEAALRVVADTPPPDAVVLARLGGDPGLLLVDPQPGTPTAEQLAARQRLAAAVLANPTTGATGRAEEVLGSGDIDARLLGLLAGLVTQFGVGIADFPQAPGEPAEGPLARRVLLDRLGGEPLGTGAPATADLLTYLDAQLPPFAPDTVEVADQGVLVGYRYASAPDELVARSTP